MLYIENAKKFYNEVNMEKNNVVKKGYSIPKTKIGLQKMNILLNAAEELFSANGFYETSVSDICKKANTAIGTFYIYFKTKTDIYECLLDRYQKRIKTILHESIQNCTTRYEKERTGIKSFIKFAVRNTTVYNIIWGSLSIDETMFKNYYTTFANSYAKSLEKDDHENSIENYTNIAFFLMGISNFLGIHAIFEKMSDEQVDAMIDNTIMPALSHGIFNNK